MGMLFVYAMWEAEGLWGSLFTTHNYLQHMWPLGISPPCVEIAFRHTEFSRKACMWVLHLEWFYCTAVLLHCCAVSPSGKPYLIYLYNSKLKSFCLGCTSFTWIFLILTETKMVYGWFVCTELQGSRFNRPKGMRNVSMAGEASGKRSGWTEAPKKGGNKMQLQTIPLSIKKIAEETAWLYWISVN